MILDSGRATAYKIAHIYKEVAETYGRQQRKIQQSVAPDSNPSVDILNSPVGYN